MRQEKEEGDGDCHMYNPMHKKQKLHENNMDEISDLPDPIVHQIMSSLNVSEITRISTLSKRFFEIWSSYPFIVFDETTFARMLQGRLREDTIKDRFLDHIYNSVLRRRINRVLSEFRVKVNLSGTFTDNRLDSVIAIVLVNGVRCMDLDFGQSSRYYFPIALASNLINVLRFTGFTLELSNIIQGCPSLGVVSIKSCVILQNIDFSSQTLTEIEFDKCEVSSIKINAPNLHSFFYVGMALINPQPCSIDVSQCQNIAYMSLTNVVNGDWIEDLVYSLSNLETLILVRCQNIGRIKVRNGKLERLEVVDCPLLASIELSAKSLESFRYKGVNSSNCDISFIASKFIKDLSIEGLVITGEWLESQIAQLHCLETLRLKGCDSLTNIKVFHETLRILELHKCLHLVEADIDTPQLIAFKYRGKLIEFCKMVSGSDCAATLDMDPEPLYNNDLYHFYRLRDLLSYFGHFKPLKIICCSQKVYSN
ncbi:F-box domain, cyclin-like protein [Artemisia annua]|uniref:F-box domain, cyclin-like protein n=1 Tax=Artemisia annua TaxID=35608 RepID=A0A2U1MPD3_ARTAN|nr:F-box domain, cyclin-like protein [Artemisia annua]